jgi:HK97 family phage prohead protease
VDTYEDRLAAIEVEWRAKYNAEELKDAAAKGHAMADESYTVNDQDDLEKAIKAVGRGNADHDTIRKHIIAQAARLKLSKLIPDNWNADGSLADEEQKAAAWNAEHREGMSYSDVRDMLSSAVAAKFGTGKNSWCYVLDFGDDWCVYESGDGEKFRCPYTVKGSDVTLGKPEPVRATTTYSPMESKAAEQWDAEHRSGPSHAQLASAISKAIGDLPDAGKLSAYLCDFDDDTATYESGGKTFQVPYKQADDGTVKLGDPQEVQRVAHYVPVESKSADTQADERAVRRRKERRRAVPLGRELRHFDVEGLEIREAANTNEIKIAGQPIVYDAPYLVRDAFGEFEERMHPGCASDVLKRGVDCRLLLNHEGLAMARTTAGTLQLLDTPQALTFEATLDARQQLANDFAIAVERKDMTQMSVGMIVGRDTWGESGGRETRDVYGLDDLLDVSGVTYPCSPSTSLEIARRMALEMPIESRARLRQMEVNLRSGQMSAEELADMLAILQGDEERAGQVLGKAHKGQLIDAAKAIHGVLKAAGYDPADLIDSDADESTSTETALAEDSTRSAEDEGEPIRSSTSASTLRLQLESRSRKGRRQQKVAA